MLQAAFLFPTFAVRPPPSRRSPPDLHSFTQRFCRSSPFPTVAVRPLFRRLSVSIHSRRQYFMDECLEKLVDIIESDKELKNLIPSERISKLVKVRGEMEAPCISKWAQALSIQKYEAKQEMMVDEVVAKAMERLKEMCPSMTSENICQAIGSSL